MRQGPNSQKLTREEIGGFFKKEGKILFDEMINKGFSFKEGFNKDKFNNFLDKAKKTGFNLFKTSQRTN